MVASYDRQVSDAELLEKNRIYDSASNEVWRRVVYNPVHDGWEFTNMGGRRILDYIGQQAERSAGRSVVELCSGLGDTCRYLASEFACHETGVEMNRRQIEQAQEKISSDARLAEKIAFVESDIRFWEPEQLFDVAFTLDSLMLVNNVSDILLKVCSALKPQGIVVLAEMTAGQNVTDELLEFIWELDGMITILKPSRYEEMLLEAGFSGIEILDVTELAEDCFGRMSAALSDEREVLLETIDADEYESWEKLTGFYHSCFQDRKFTYSRITARRQ